MPNPRPERWFDDNDWPPTHLVGTVFSLLGQTELKSLIRARQRKYRLQQAYEVEAPLLPIASFSYHILKVHSTWYLEVSF